MTVYVLTCHTAIDYETSLDVRVFPNLQAAQNAMEDDVRSFWNENENCGWVEEELNDCSICYQEEGDYSKNHIEWVISEHEVEYDSKASVSPEGLTQLADAEYGNISKANVEQ